METHSIGGNMKTIYNKNKTMILENVDLENGYLAEDTIIHEIAEVEEVAEQSHLELIKEYDNGGKDYKKVIDVKAVSAVPFYQKTEEIDIYIPYTIEQLHNSTKSKLRENRERLCFSVINRGKLWYDTLTTVQLAALAEWYALWLNVTTSLQEPTTPDFIK